MFFDPRTPIVIGLILISAVIGVLFVYSPIPGDVSLSHQQLIGVTPIQSCASCHHEDGFNEGCLSCHHEIDEQLRERRGYHHYLAENGKVDCAPCHQEHNGKGFSLINSDAWGAQTFRGFKHPHLEFNLGEAHDDLMCESCHKGKLAEPFILAGFPDSPRYQSFLGLNQECLSCHLDVHANGLSGACDSCHDQANFSPTPHFDHSEKFALAGAHENVECAGCHIIPHPDTARRDPPFPFHKVRGKECRDCHNSPHEAIVANDCESCHDKSEPRWSSAIAYVSQDIHSLTGFRLIAPHDNISCQKCHDPNLPFSEKYPSRSSPEYARSEGSCEGCHEDVHYGQFRSRHERCMDCHTAQFFKPATFSHRNHEASFSLWGAHEAVACLSCHLEDAETNVTRFVGTSAQCKNCHQSPHGGQFALHIDRGDCDSCHDPKRDNFGIRTFDHKAIAGYALEGAHARAQCDSCHVEFDEETLSNSNKVRRYRNTPVACASCHHDIHRGQFDEYGQESCKKCHTSFDSWDQIHFDHDSQTRFPLTNAHSRAGCSRCHVSAALEDGKRVVQYRPLGRECTNCHDIDSE